jgi:hypothetical protein
MSASNWQFLVFIKKNPITVVCTIVSLVVIFLIYWRSDELPAARAVLEQRSKEGERLTGNVKYSAQLKEQLDELIAAGKAIDARLVNATRLEINQQFFYKLEADTGVRVLNPNQIAPNEKSKNAKTSFIPVGFSMNVQGSYGQILDFLHRLENGLHYCRVLNATVVKVGVDGDSLTLNLNLELLGQR